MSAVTTWNVNVKAWTLDNPVGNCAALKPIIVYHLANTQHWEKKQQKNTEFTVAFPLLRELLCNPALNPFKF